MPLVELCIGDQTICYDRERTRQIYATIPTGDAEECGCLDCQNFARQRGNAYPETFLQLLDQLGIDPAKEGEAFRYSSDADGKSLYGGWFFLVGEIVEAGRYLNECEQDTRKFQFWFTRSCPQAPAWLEESYTAVEFTAEIDWMLPEPPEW